MGRLLTNALNANPIITFTLTNVWISAFWDNSEIEDTALIATQHARLVKTHKKINASLV